MTFKVTVLDRAKNPVPYAIVGANDELSGQIYQRGTDGGGYADVALFGVPNGRQMTLSVQASGFINHIEYPTTTANDQVIQVILDSFNRPFKTAPRFWKGNFCGVRIPGAPPVDGGAPDSSLILSWFYDRYPKAWRDIIRANWKAKGHSHIVTSWPDSRSYGFNEDAFILTQLELMDDGFFPCPFLSSKDHDPADPVQIMQGLDNLLPKLKSIGIPLICIGWELSLWLQPVEVQMLIDTISPIFTPIGTRVYVHFQEAYMAFQNAGGSIADFWNLQINKLTGVLYQKKISQNRAEFLDSLSDCLQRMCGGFFMPDDSGFGHPFDLVGMELTAMSAFNDNMLEQEQNIWGQTAINAPHCFGPQGVEAWVMGSDNGF